MIASGWDRLSNEDSKRVRKPNPRKLELLQRTRDALTAAGIVPGSIVRRLDRVGTDLPTNFVFVSLQQSGRVYLGALKTFDDYPVYLSKLDTKDPSNFELGLEFIESPVDGWVHRTFAILTLREQVFRNEGRNPPNLGARARAFFPKRLSANQVQHRTYGEYWQEHALKVLMAEFREQHSI